MIASKERREPIIFDTTLREGFQTPGGIGGSLEERVYAAALIQNYAHWVEIGMPANNVDYDIISAIRDRFLAEKYPVGLAVLARCADLDVERSAEVMASYPNNLIHLFVGTSDEHRAVRFGGQDKDYYAQKISKYVEMAAANPVFLRVMFSPEDSYRTWAQDHETLIRFIEAAKKAYDRGNTKVGRKEPVIFNLPDTVGASTVEEFCGVIEHVQQVFGNDVEWSVHCHNDNRMSQAQALTVYERFGVPWIQTTFAQLGERNGIAATDLTVKILSERGYLNEPRITSLDNLRLLDPTMNAIMWTLGRMVPKEHLDRTNISTAGIHTDLVVKDTSTYHIRGDRYGSQIYIELGPTSGSKQVIDVLEKNRFPYTNVPKEDIEKFTERLKHESNAGKFPISETHILYEALKEFLRFEDDGLKVTKYRSITKYDGVELVGISGSIDGTPFRKVHKSRGPVEAVMELLNGVINEHRGTDSEIALVDYLPYIVPIIGKEYLNWEVGQRPQIPREVGKHAHQGVYLMFRNGSGVYQGWARHENSSKAPIDAVIDGMTKMYALQKWQNLARHSK